MLFHTKILTLGCLIVALALMAFAPGPKLRGVGATFRLAPDSSVVVDAAVHLTGSLQAPDSIRYTAHRNDSLQSARVTKSLAQTMTMGAPAYGQTARYKVCAQVKRGTGRVGATPCSAPWTYTRPLPPPPVVDSVILRPVSANLVPGQSQQFCAFCRLSDATVQMCNPLAGQVPYCDQQFAGYLSERAA